MSGTAQHNLRSASVAETTPGAIVATPSFATMHDPILMTATPEIFEQPSLSVGGALAGIGIKAIPINGSMSGAFTYGTLDDWLAGLLQGTWASNVLKDGKTRSTRTVENTFDAGSGGTATMLRYRGIEAVGGRLVIASETEVQYVIDMMGMGSDDGTTTAITGATYSDPSNAVPMTSGIDVGAITMAGYAPGDLQAAEIDFAFEGRNRQSTTTGFDTGGTTLGACRPKVTATALIDANFAAIYAAARSAHSTFAVTFNIGSVSGSKYTLAFPKCSFASGDVDLSGAELLQKIDIIPQYDAGTSAVITLTRSVS